MHRVLAGSLLLLVTACATTRLVDTAYHGDLITLKGEIAEARSAGALDASTLRDLARAVAERAIRSAPPDKAVERIQQIRPCARALLDELRVQARRTDDAGAEAQLVLLTLGKADGDSLVSSYARDGRGAWRALAAAATAAPRHARLRRGFYVDPDARVRRGAFQAALTRPDATDLEVLLESARLDPDPHARSLAARAVGAIGRERAVLSLTDLWARSTETERLGLIEAWSMPASTGAGGTERLIRIVESETGLARIAAAAALVRFRGAGAELGRDVLVRSVSAGSATDERRLALLSLPLDEPAIAAITGASRATDEPVRVLALARLLEHPRTAPDARLRLVEMARGGTRAARQARAALAAAGDRGVFELLRRDLASRDAASRRSAALGLIRLGEAPVAADVLADPDPTVRLGVACTLIGPPAA
jgi:hypothetical protein